MFDEEILENSDTRIDSLSDYVEKRLGRYSEIKHYEIIGGASSGISMEIEKGEISFSDFDSLSIGMGLRLIGNKGQEAHLYSTMLGKESIERMITRGLKILKVAPPNKYFKDIAKPSPSYNNNIQNFDTKIKNYTIEDLGDIISPILDLNDRKPTPKGISGDFVLSISLFKIINSNGIRSIEKRSRATLACDVTLENNGVYSNGFDSMNCIRIEDVDPKKIADKSYNMAHRGLRKDHIQTGRYPVIFTPDAFSSVLIGPLLDAMNADALQNNRSFLVGREGTRIAAEGITLCDNPAVPWKIGSMSIDGEGLATEPLFVVKDGIFEAKYHNTLTAAKENVESNAHASRGSYMPSLGISNYNVLMKSGDVPYSDLIADVKKGILFEYTADSPNRVTGDFSGLIMVGYIIENGEVGPALQESLIGLNILDSLKRISEISKEREWVDELYLPYIKIDDVAISGRY